MKCTKWHAACFCFVRWGCAGSRESVGANRAECSHCTLAAFFTMVTLSNQAHGSGLTASRALCARGPLSQALNHWAEILWQLVSTAQHSWTASFLIDSLSVLPPWTLCYSFLLHISPPSFRVKVVLISDEVLSRTNNIQCQDCEPHAN